MARSERRLGEGNLHQSWHLLCEGRMDRDAAALKMRQQLQPPQQKNLVATVHPCQWAADAVLAMVLHPRLSNARPGPPVLPQTQMKAVLKGEAVADLQRIMHQALDDGLATMKGVISKDLHADLEPLKQDVERLKASSAHR